MDGGEEVDGGEDVDGDDAVALGDGAGVDTTGVCVRAG